MVSIILVRPQLGENIGAVARIMFNFAVTELRLVAPRDGWPNQKAEDNAVGAIQLIRDATLYDTVEEALRDMQIVYATSARNRDLNKAVTTPERMANEIVGSPGDQKCAILFGPERSGLTNDELTLANKLINIPTNSFYSSLNLSHSVGIVCYELFKQVNPFLPVEQSQELANQQELLSFFEALEVKLRNRNFFRVAEKEPSMTRNIRNIFKRINPLTKQDIKTLYGIINCLSETD
jgi:tRNA/rRNA methyltransferase